MNQDKSSTNQDNQNQPQQQGNNKQNSEDNNIGPVDSTDVSETMKDPDAWKRGDDSTISPIHTSSQAGVSSPGNNNWQGNSNNIKDPDEWKTGDEPMTGAQRSYLHTLADEAGEDVNDNLTKAEAAKRIEELQKKTGRGTNQQNQQGGGGG